MADITISDEAYAKLQAAWALRKEYLATYATLQTLQAAVIESTEHERTIWQGYLEGRFSASKYAEARKAQLAAAMKFGTWPNTNGDFLSAQHEAIEAIARDLFPQVRP